MSTRTADPRPSHADRVAASVARSVRHADSEYVTPFDVDAVMETVSRPSELTWSDCLAWVLPRFDERGKLALEVGTDRDDVRSHYNWVSDRGERQRYDLYARLATDWWVLYDSEWSGVSPISRKQVDSEAFSFHFTDGSGISSEMTSIKLDVAPAQTHAQRCELFHGYFAAHRAGDVDRLLGMFSDEEYAGCAVRPYFGDPGRGLAVLDTRASLKAHYEQLFAAAEVEDIVLLNTYIKDWFFFAEARWRMRLTDGTHAAMTTAEVMLLGSDGLIAGRLGYGKPLEIVA